MIWQSPTKQLPKPNEKILIVTKETPTQRRTIDIGYFRNIGQNTPIFTCSYLQAGFRPDEIDCWIYASEIMPTNLLTSPT